MKITLRYIAEQVIRRMGGFAPGADLEVTPDDLYPYITQAINKMLKTEYVKIKMSLADDHPQGASLATFSNIDVVAYDEGLILGCETLRLDTEEQQWAEADGDVWVEADGDIWVLSGATSVRIQSSETSEQLYSVTVDQIVYPSGTTNADLIAFITNAPADGYIHFRVNSEEVPKKFYRGAISNIQDATTGVSFDYDLLEIQNAAPEVQTIVRPSALLMRNKVVSKDDLTMLKVDRCSTEYSGSASTRGAALLPTQPLSLPYGQGIWRVYDQLDPETDFVPVGNVHYGVINGISHTGLKELLEGQVTYTWFNNDRIVFNTPVALLPNSITMQLVVVSLDQVGEFDPLPIPADYEADVVEAVFVAVMRAKNPDYQVDSTEEPQ